MSSSYPTAEVLFGAFQVQTGNEQVDRILHSIGQCVQDAAMGRVHSDIGRSLCSVCEPRSPGIRIYDLLSIGRAQSTGAIVGSVTR